MPMADEDNDREYDCEIVRSANLQDRNGNESDGVNPDDVWDIPDYGNEKHCDADNNNSKDNDGEKKPPEIQKASDDDNLAGDDCPSKVRGRDCPGAKGTTVTVAEGTAGAVAAASIPTESETGPEAGFLPTGRDQMPEGEDKGSMIAAIFSRIKETAPIRPSPFSSIPQTDDVGNDIELKDVVQTFLEGKKVDMFKLHTVDFPSYVIEHDTTLTFPEKVSTRVVEGGREG